jgi:DNA-binding IclR family transcriptional regulator
MARSESGESLLERVVRILNAFNSDVQVLRVGDLAARAGLPVSTTSRLVDQMVAQGLLKRADDRTLSVGVRLWELAHRASPTLGLREAAMPFMEDLHAVTGHHVQLGVRQDLEVLFVERLSAPRSVVNITRIAGRLPLHASSSGLVLLAYAPRDIREQVLSSSLHRYTSATLADPVALRAALAHVRRVQYALCAGHIHLDACSLAVPLRDRGGQLVAALSLVVPNDGTAISHLPTLQMTARAIQRTLTTQSH